MSSPSTTTAPPPDPGFSTARPDRWTLLLFLASDLAGFLALLVVHGLLANASAQEASLDVPLASAMTAALLLSSFTAHRYASTGSGRWLGSTLALGALFLVGQAFEWSGAIQDGLSAGSSVFAATFYAVTGFHGLHVLVGLLLFPFALLSRRGSEARRRYRDNVVLYWHFVDVVWVLVFVRVYL